MANIGLMEIFWRSHFITIKHFCISHLIIIKLLSQQVNLIICRHVHKIFSTFKKGKTTQHRVRIPGSRENRKRVSGSAISVEGDRGAGTGALW